MKNRKRTWKNLPRMTVFERGHAIEVGHLLSQNVDPLAVEIHSINGSYAFTYRDLAHHLELTGKPFDLTKSYFQVVDRGEDYERRKISSKLLH